MLTVFSFRLQPSFLGWSEAPRSETDSLFRDEKRMQAYLADYHFTNWRDLKMRYRIWPVSAAAKSELGRTAAVPEGPAWLLAEKKKTASRGRLFRVHRLWIKKGHSWNDITYILPF